MAATCRCTHAKAVEQRRIFHAVVAEIFGRISFIQHLGRQALISRERESLFNKHIVAHNRRITFVYIHLGRSSVVVIKNYQRIVNIALCSPTILRIKGA